MKFKPLTDDSTKGFVPLAEGRYYFTVSDAQETVSKSGNPMIKIVLSVESKFGNRRVFDYLLSTGKKLRSFCQATGLEDKYNHGEITDFDCLNKEGEVQLSIEKNEQYGDKNIVIYYAVKKSASKSEQETIDSAVEKAFDDDEIPF